MQSTKSVKEVRAFLRLRLDPGPNHAKRTVGEVAERMPDWLAVEIAAHSPQVAALREVALHAQAAYAEGLRAWIQDQTRTEGETTR